jgi:DNA-binding Lrp family transcriptional regulator
MNLDSVDRKLLNLMQAGFPLVGEPYADLGMRSGIDGDEVLRRIARLKSEGILRQISPVFNTRSLGYQTTLVAIRVGENQLDRAEGLIAEHPGVSHGYERDHYFNLWFTLAAPAGVDLQMELQQLTGPLEAEAVLALPAIKLFKIGTYFDMDGDGQAPEGTGVQPVDTSPERLELSPTDRLIINELQQDLPLTPKPFTALAARSGMEVEDFLAHCQSLLQRGIMRRFSASINHRRAGFTANAMSCWIAPPDRLDAAGQKLASLREVSHCYERKTSPLWQYNLFAMIHGQTREACQDIVRDISRKTGLTDYVMLFSTKEFKKARVKYLV